jgi:hypothetical protein
MDFIVTSYMKLAPAPGRAAVLAGQKLSTHPLGGGVRITGPVAWTNEGTIELRSSSGIAAESAFATADGRITNNGTIRIMDLSGRIEGTMVNNGSIVKNRGDAIFTKGLENVGTLTVEQEARVNITGGPTTNSGTITLGPAATLTFGGDVTNTGRLVLDPTSSVNLPTASFLPRAPDAAERDEAVRHYTDLIRAGRLHSWIGQPRPHTGLALAPVGETELLIRNTYNGDANLDGLVNADDYFRIDSNFLAPPPEPTYAHGDFNYDGTINADDYFLIDSAFLAQGTPLAGSGDSPPLMSAAAVPEPSALFLLVIAAGSSTRRSRDRR